MAEHMGGCMLTLFQESFPQVLFEKKSTGKVMTISFYL